MKKLIVSAFIALAIGLSVPSITRAQGTIYFSNLGATPAGSLPAAADSWLATEFDSGTNSSGYRLDSIQLGMAAASGAPGGLAAMLYTSLPFGAAPYPGSSVGSLTGPSNPSTAGVYIYSPAGDLLLSPRTSYFIVLTAATPVADGAYPWSYASTWSYNRIDAWNGTLCYNSTDGASWHSISSVYPLFAINATPEANVPEPNTAAVLGLGLLALLLRKCGTHA